MEQVLEIREIIIRYFKRYETFIMPVLKFFLGVLVYSLINSIGHNIAAFDFIAKTSLKTPFILLMAIIFTVLPLSINYALMILNIALQFSASYEVAAIVGAVLLLVLLFYVRVAGKEICLVLATFLGFYFKLPYLAPLIAGLYLGVKSVIPITIGVFLWSFAPVALSAVAVEPPKAAGILDIPTNVSQTFSLFLEALKDNNDWAVTAFVFALVLIVVYTISHLSIDYGRQIALALGVVINIISFIFLSIVTEFKTGIIALIISSLISGIIAFVVMFFDCVLNYAQAERVEFEDDENYYYVKVIPKIIISPKTHTVRQIRGTKEKAVSVQEDDVYDDEPYNDHPYNEEPYGDGLYERPEEDDYEQRYNRRQRKNGYDE